MSHPSTLPTDDLRNPSVYKYQVYNRRDPNPWDVLYIDEAIPLDPVAKAYMLKDLQHWTRSYLLIPIKAIANLLLAIIMTVKRLLPFQFRAYRFMHQVAAWFLNTFVTPEACYLIIRHIGLGSNIVNFLIDNGPSDSIERSTLYPKTVNELTDRLAFLEHDLILYNFVWDYHQAQQKNPQWLAEVPKRGLNFSSIQPIIVNIDVEQERGLRILDLESAIELFKVFYSLCLTSEEFARAVLSLQLDENFGLYISHLTGDERWNHLITNRHPLIPNSPFNAARDLFLHGLLTEYLHRYLEISQENQGGN